MDKQTIELYDADFKTLKEALLIAKEIYQEMGWHDNAQTCRLLTDRIEKQHKKG